MERGIPAGRVVAFSSQGQRQRERCWCLCRFMIGRERPGEQSEVAQLIQQTLEQERWQREMMEQRYAQYGEDDEEVGTPPGWQRHRPLVA